MKSSDGSLVLDSDSPSVIIIDPNGDIAIRLYSEGFGKTFRGDDGVTTKQGTLLATYQVSTELLKKHSRYFVPLLSSPWLRPDQLEVDICEPHAVAFEVWLRIFHGTVDETSFKAEIVDVYYAIELSRKYFLEVERLTEWFTNWADRNGGDRMSLFTMWELQQLLYPCFELEYVSGFANATRRLAYEFSGHITEINRTNYWHLHLHPRVMSALNAARGNLKTQIHKEVYQTRQFLHSGCSCKKDGLFAYEMALESTAIWPLEQVLTGKQQRSIQSVLDGLRTFSYQAPNDTCALCSCDFGLVVRDSANKVQHNFDGLCLDCIDESLKKDWDKDYRRPIRRPTSRYTRNFQSDDSSYDDGCRITHGQPTWYFSSIARKQVQDAHQKARDNRRETENAKNAENASKKRKLDSEDTL